MIKEEIWSVSIQRARAFFREQEDVQEIIAEDTVEAVASETNS